MNTKAFFLSLTTALILAAAMSSQVAAKEIHSTDALYPAVGPYSQMV